jgi:hypothetical protein
MYRDFTGVNDRCRVGGDGDKAEPRRCPSRSPRRAAARDRGIDGDCLDKHAFCDGDGGSAAGENTQNMSLDAPPSPFQGRDPS